MDGLRDFLSEKVLAVLSYILAGMQMTVRLLRHIAVIHEDVEYRIYNISINHKDTVQKLLTNVDPNFYRTLVKSFSKLNFVEASKRWNFCTRFLLGTRNAVYASFRNSWTRSGSRIPATTFARTKR